MNNSPRVAAVVRRHRIGSFPSSVPIAEHTAERVARVQHLFAERRHRIAVGRSRHGQPPRFALIPPASRPLDNLGAASSRAKDASISCRPPARSTYRCVI